MSDSIEKKGLTAFQTCLSCSRCAALAGVFLVTLNACASVEGFRRMEIGHADPEAVFQSAVSVVKMYYSKVHGGLNLFVDDEELRFETSWISKKMRQGFHEKQPRVTSSHQLPIRQKLYGRVVFSPGGVDIELFARTQRFDIESADSTDSIEDCWKFLRQDTQVEDIIYKEILKDLMEKGLLD